MPPINPRQRHTKNRQRRLDGSLWQMRLNHLLTPPRAVPDLRRPPRGAGLFGAPVQRRGRRGNQEEEFLIEKIWAKKWINDKVFYLIQWVGYTELTWEPEKNLKWQDKAQFDLDNVDAVWAYMSTRGRRAPVGAARLGTLIIKQAAMAMAVPAAPSKRAAPRGTATDTSTPAALASKYAVDTPLVALFVFSIALKLLLLPSYTSTDFEVHRNWLAITHSLPRAQWYHEATSEWTLDYPPFFAYFEYALSCLAAFVDPALVVISATPVFSDRILLFQRLTVIGSDTVLFYAIYAYCASWPRVTTTEAAFSTQKRLVVMLLTVLDAGLLYVDHIHFQYNGMLLGLLILSATKFRLQQDLQGALLYAVLLMFKHIYLYAAPLYFVYLLGHHCYVVASPNDHETSGERDTNTSSNSNHSTTTKPRRKRSISNTDLHETIQSHHDGKATFSLFRFLRLGVLVLTVFGAAFGSVLSTHADPIAGLKQIFTRLFPVQRGLCHAYWAPNVWALYAFIDKLLTLTGAAVLTADGGAAGASVARMSGGLVQEASFAVLPSVSPIACALLTFASMAPVLVSVWKYPDSSLFMSALVVCMHSSFMLGYHVHEKAILQVLLPLALLAAESVNDMRLYRFASIASSISLFPLLFTPAEQGTKVLIALIHALLAYVTLDPLLKDSLKKRHIRATHVALHTIEKLYLAVLVTVAIASALFPFVPRVGVKYPFVPLMVTSVVCAVANVYVWGFAIHQHFRKLEAVKSYMLPKK